MNMHHFPKHPRAGKSLRTFAHKIPLAMKLFFLCLFCSIGTLHATDTYAQNARITPFKSA